MELCVKCNGMVGKIKRLDAKSKGVECIVAEEVIYCSSCDIVFACATCPVIHCEKNPA